MGFTTPATSGNILVIDDDSGITALVKEMLSLEGYEVAVAHSARSGIETASRLHPDVILMDIGMPEMDGYAAVKCLRRAPDLNETPVIFLTAGSEGDNPRPQSVSSEPICIKKPFRLADLRGVVSRAVCLRREDNTL